VVLSSVRFVNLLVNVVGVDLAKVVLEHVCHDGLGQDSVVAAASNNEVALGQLINHFFHSFRCHTGLAFWVSVINYFGFFSLLLICFIRVLIKIDFKWVVHGVDADIIFGRLSEGLTRLDQVSAFWFDVDWVMLLHGDSAGRKLDFTHSHKVHQLRQLAYRSHGAKPKLFRSLLLLNLCLHVSVSLKVLS